MASSELQWRRRWKPTLAPSPWRPLGQVEITGGDDSDSSPRYLIKTKFDDNSYELLLTDLTHFWYEKLANDHLMKRVVKLNPSIEAPVTKVLDQIRCSLEKPGKETHISLTHKNEEIVLEISSLLAGMPFHYSFKATSASNEMGRDHLTIPLMAMVGELYRQQQELFKSLALKDRQIDDYKAQGAVVSRKYLDTSVFDEIAFHNSMVTSKGFEEEVKTFGEKAFTSLGQDLYREISTKRAWLLSSPAKGGDMEIGEPTGSISGGVHGGPSVESWSNRLPTSMAQKNVSPSKTATSNNSISSPASSKGSSTEMTPDKDTELKRRQSLERKLEQEEVKQQEKVRKKKKLKF